MIHLAGPVVLASVLAGAGVYGMLARRNAVLVLVGAELLVAASGVLFVTASALPAGGLAGLERPGAPPGSVPAADPLLSGQVFTIFAVTIAAAEIGLALAVILLLFRVRRTSDLSAVRELGEASRTYTEEPGADAPGAVPGPATGDGAAADATGDGAAADAAASDVAVPGGAAVPAGDAP
ncbi:MAG: NADH-quinone oxidoreductase subunit NuoK [Kineosporiaceae bacterium]